MKILKVLWLSRILQLSERWKIRKWQIFEICCRIRSITVGMKDVFIWFGHWINLGNFGSQFLTEIYKELFILLEMWKFQNVDYALGFYSLVSDKKYANIECLKLWFNVWILYTNIPHFKWIKFSNIHHFLIFYPSVSCKILDNS